MYRPLRLYPVLLCIGCLGFAGAGAAPAVAPCELLTLPDVQDAVGGQWRVWQDLSGEDVCAYQSSPSSIISLQVVSDPMGATAILELRRTAAGDKARPADGIGEGAYRLVMPTANVVMFGKGETVVQLEVSFAASTDTAVAEKLAKAAYDRLP